MRIILYILLFTLAYLQCNRVPVPVEEISLYMYVSVHKFLQKTLKEEPSRPQHPDGHNLKYNQIQTRDISGNVSAVDDNRVGVCVHVCVCLCLRVLFFLFVCFFLDGGGCDSHRRAIPVTATRGKRITTPNVQQGTKTSQL